MQPQSPLRIQNTADKLYVIGVQFLFVLFLSDVIKKSTQTDTKFNIISACDTLKINNTELLTNCVIGSTISLSRSSTIWKNFTFSLLLEF